MTESACLNDSKVFPMQDAHGLNKRILIEARSALSRAPSRRVCTDVGQVSLHKRSGGNGCVAVRIIHSNSLSVVSAHSTVAAGGEVASLPTESPALCTTCDIRLDDTSIRACSVRDCPHAQQEAA